ncbi:hypothetical protein C0993_012003 [Termitomyces sp. T159_Od127]|nr:hypothetical protein C0993_012003 [Termitomyces sp. T159_Od127]
MTQHAESSQVSESTVRTDIGARARPPDESRDAVDVVRARAEACQRLIDEAVEGRIAVPQFIQALKDMGLNAAEARDHADEVMQRIEIRNEKARNPDPPAREETLAPDDSEEHARDAQARAVEVAAWEALQERLAHAMGPMPVAPAVTIEQLAELLGDPKKTTEASPIPQSTLTAVPHLASLQNKVSEDPHISRTWYLRHEYSKEKVVDSLISLGQSQPLKEPISRAMWRLVILDQFVDFDKLYATFDRGYDHADEPKEFMGGFSLVRKDHASARKPVRTEYDWIRTFDAWMAAVVLFYPHREEELLRYRNRILDFCRTIPNGILVAIRFDIDTRDRYARNPFRMDDENRLHMPFLAQLLSIANPPSNNKRTAVSHFGPRKKPATVCQNWNLGICTADSCPGGRRHNICSECNGPHKARDVEECFKRLNVRRQQYRSTISGGN